jgi:hypothetical protein
MAVAVFNYAQFIARYPQFASVSSTQLGAYFVEAGLYLSNSDCSPVQNVTKRGLLLNMLTAHISELNGDLSADGQFKPVGRVSQAAEGSVSAALDYNPQTPGTGPWFQQTQAGASFWAATANLRTMRYSPRPTYYGQRRGYGFWR